MILSAICVIAFAGNSFASNEVNVDSTVNIETEENTVNGNAFNNNILDNAIDTSLSYPVCHEELYGYYVTHYVSHGLSMDGNTYYTMTTVFNIVGGCTTCLYINGSTKDCWGITN